MLTMTILAAATAARIAALVLIRTSSRFPVRLSCVDRFLALTGFPLVFVIAWRNRVVKLGHPPQSSWANPMESPIVTRFQPAGPALAAALGMGLDVSPSALGASDTAARHAPSSTVKVASSAETCRPLVIGSRSASA